MSFPRYPAYKPSGVEWLGEVPEHWEFKKLKHCILRLGSGGTPESSNPEFWADDDSEDSIPWVAIGDMSAVSRVTSTAKSLTPFGLSSKNLEIFPSGSLLYSIYASLGKVAILGMDAAFNQAILAILPNTQCVSQPFLRCWLESLERHLEYYASSNTQANLNAAKVLSYPVSVPSLPEQRAIATFLDHETAKIDALIAEQQSLIELLQEKRQAVISHAVTKGLNPEAPMKDSGVEWLGEVPEHWGLITLGRLCISKCDGPFGSGLKSEHYVEEGVLVVRLQNIKFYGYDDTVSAYIDSDYYETSLGDHDVIPGDLLIAGLGDENNLVGRACVAPSHLGPAMVKADCFRFRLNRERISPAFASFSLNASSRFHGGILSSGSTRSRIPLSMMTSREVALPPIEEQLKIEMHIQNQLGRINALQYESVSAVQLLQERRSALISAAVTGQIDVRGLVPEASTA